MIVIALVSALLGLLGLEASSLQDAPPEEIINTAIHSINKYNLDNKYQNLQFNDYRVESVLYKFSASKLQLGDLSTIQIKPHSQPSITSMISNTGTTHSYKATLELGKGFVQYDILLNFLLIFSSSGTVTATSKHSFEVEGTVIIDSVHNCKADVSKIDVKVGHLQVVIKPGGIFNYILKPLIQYLTNSNSQAFLPPETMIANYIKNSIPKSKFSEMVCDAFK